MAGKSKTRASGNRAPGTMPGPAGGAAPQGKKVDPLSPKQYTKKQYEDALLAGFGKKYPAGRVPTAKKPLTIREMETNTIARNKWTEELIEKAKEGAEIRKHNKKVENGYKKAGTRRVVRKRQ